MEIAEVRIAVDRTWRLHIAKGVVLVAAFVAWHKLEMPRWFWIAMCGSIGMSYAEWTWNEWRQRRILLSLQAPLSLDQFRVLRARERLHNAVRIAVFILPWTVWALWIAHFPAPFILILSVMPAICVWKVRKAADELQQASS